MGEEKDFCTIASHFSFFSVETGWTFDAESIPSNMHWLNKSNVTIQSIT